MPTGYRELIESAESTWEQAITMEELAESMCFTTSAHQAVAALLSDSGEETK